MRAQSRGIRIAVIGVGYWGSRHIRVLRSIKGVTAVIGVDQRFAAIDDGSRRAGQCAAEFADIEEALPHIDAAIIATPPRSHAALALRVIAAGKHVLVEKPMATTTDMARSLTEAAEEAGVLLMPGHTFEHNSAVHKLRDLLREGHLGRVFHLDSARLNLGLYQADVNVVLDLAPHDISISNFVLCSRPTTVTAWGSRHMHPEYEDVAYLRLDYADLGVQANIHVSWLYPQKVRRTTVVGSKKMVVYNDLADGERIRVYDKAVVPPDAGDGPLNKVAYHLGDAVVPFVPFAEPLAVQDQHFVDCVISGSAPAVDASSGLAVVQALECAQISLREQRPVALAEVSGKRTATRAAEDLAFAGMSVD